MKNKKENKNEITLTLGTEVKRGQDRFLTKKEAINFVGVDKETFEKEFNNSPKVVKKKKLFRTFYEIDTLGFRRLNLDAEDNKINSKEKNDQKWQV